MTDVVETPPNEMQLPSYRWRFAHLAALWAFGVSQPVFSMLKGNPEFLVVRGSTRLDVVSFALLVAFVLPLFVVGGRGAPVAGFASAGRGTTIVAIWCFGFLAVLQFARLLDTQRGGALLLPVVPAALVAVAYLRSRGVPVVPVRRRCPAAGRTGHVRRNRSTGDRQRPPGRGRRRSEEHPRRRSGDGRVPAELPAPTGRVDRRAEGIRASLKLAAGDATRYPDARPPSTSLRPRQSPRC